MRLNDYASIIVQCCLLAQRLALQLVYRDVQGPRELGLQAPRTAGGNSSVSNRRCSIRLCLPVSDQATNMGAACKIKPHAQYVYIHVVSERHVSSKGDAYLNMGNDVWQVKEGPSC